MKIIDVPVNLERHYSEHGIDVTGNKITFVDNEGAAVLLGTFALIKKSGEEGWYFSLEADATLYYLHEHLFTFIALVLSHNNGVALDECA